jgi:hypothetical protein
MTRAINSRLCPRLLRSEWILLKKKRSYEFALELVFEDDPMPRRERNKDEGGEGGAFREDDRRVNAGCG